MKVVAQADRLRHLQLHPLAACGRRPLDRVGAGNGLAIPRLIAARQLACAPLQLPCIREALAEVHAVHLVFWSANVRIGGWLVAAHCESLQEPCGARAIQRSATLQISFERVYTKMPAATCQNVVANAGQASGRGAPSCAQSHMCIWFASAPL